MESYLKALLRLKVFPSRPRAILNSKFEHSIIRPKLGAVGTLSLARGRNAAHPTGHDSRQASERGSLRRGEESLRHLLRACAPGRISLRHGWERPPGQDMVHGAVPIPRSCRCCWCTVDRGAPSRKREAACQSISALRQRALRSVESRRAVSRLRVGRQVPHHLGAASGGDGGGGGAIRVQRSAQRRELVQGLHLEGACDGCAGLRLVSWLKVLVQNIL